MAIPAALLKILRGGKAFGRKALNLPDLERGAKAGERAVRGSDLARRGPTPKDPGYWGRQAVTRKRFPNVEQKELHRQAIDPYDPKTQFLTGAEHGESTGDLIRLERELNRGRPKMLAELEELQRSFAPTDPRMQEIRELIDRLRGKV